MQHQSGPPPSSSPPPVHHLDYTGASTHHVQRFTLTWFPATRDERAHPRFYTVVQEDMYMAYVDLEYLANIVG